VNTNEASDPEQVQVLVVGADADARSYLEALLENEGYTCLCLERGQQVVEVVRRERPEAVVLGGRPADMDAVELVTSLRSAPETGRLVVMLVADSGQQQLVRRALEAGADDYLLRPFQAEEIALRLKMRFRQRDTSWRLEEQEALLDLTRLLASSLEIDQLLHLVAVRTARVLRVDRCSMVLVDPGGNQATVLAASESAALQGIRVDLSNYPEIEEVIRTRRPFVVDRVEDNPKLRGILPTLVNKGVGSLALFPMLDGQRVSGVLFLRSERFRHSLGERDIFFANAVAAAVALSLRNLDAVEKQKRISAELQQTKDFLENLINSSVDAIVAADLKGRIILFNKGAERIFGWNAEEVLGRMHVTQLYPEGGAHEVMALLRREGGGGQFRLNPIRKEVLNKSGEVIPIQLTAWGVMENGRLAATAGIFTDLRERLHIERQLSQAQEKLVRTEKQAMIAELAGATAHELNQPLTSVMGYTELAKRKLAQPEEVSRILDIILSETERMADIVRKIGRITKYETKSYVGGQRIVDIDRSSEPE